MRKRVWDGMRPSAVSNATKEYRERVGAGLLGSGKNPDGTAKVEADKDVSPTHQRQKGSAPKSKRSRSCPEKASEAGEQEKEGERAGGQGKGKDGGATPIATGDSEDRSEYHALSGSEHGEPNSSYSSYTPALVDMESSLGKSVRTRIGDEVRARLGVARAVAAQSGEGERRKVPGVAGGHHPEEEEEGRPRSGRQASRRQVLLPPVLG